MDKTDLLVCLIFYVVALGVRAQDNYDVNYLEDQLYVGIGYNLLVDKPETVIQRNLSYNLQIGFVKDIPLNEKRNFGLGVGLGYATNSYYTNMFAIESDLGTVYRFPDAYEGFDRTKLETHAVEFPFEVRWRTSNPVDYKFWRIYGGFKVEYLFSRKSKLVSDDLSVFEGNTSFSNATIEQWQYGLMLNLGYNTWNLHLYWALSNLLDGDAILDNAPLKIRPLRIGVIFYIL